MTTATIEEKKILNWAELLPASEWASYRAALLSLQTSRIPFALGGGLAFSAYSLRWRNTKDMDLYVLPADREAVAEALMAGGFEDYYDRSPYDRSWSYRSFREDIIIDALWGMPNHVAEVQESWLSDGPALDVHDVRLKLLPVEALVFVKLYVMQRERCDWPDIFNILYAQGTSLDWRRLFALAGDDVLLLGAAVAAFRWLCPKRAAEFPTWIWEPLGIVPPTGKEAENDRSAAALLDARDWFGPKTPENR